MLVLAMCSTARYGSVGEEGVQEALSSPRMAITPHQPRWLLPEAQVHSLSAEQIEQVRAILRPEKMRSVPEKFYRDETEGNRGDTTTQIFYLSTSSGQSLGGRVIGNKALMDDFELSEQETAALYTLLREQLRKVAASR